MGQYDYTRYMPVTSDGGARDIFNSQFRNLRFSVPIAKQIQISAALAYNPFAIALGYLGEEQLWWVIIAFNGLYNPRSDLYPGRVINIPDRSSLLRFLETSSVQSTQFQL
jgi:hypothetical protein